MPSYFSPGIYVEEVPSGARPIGPASTSIAAFVGVAPDRSAHLGKAVPVNNWTEFLRLFAGGERVESTPLARAVFGFLDNGGARCWVVNVGEGGAITGTGQRRGGLQLLEAVDEISIIAAPGFHDVVSHEALLSMAERTRTMVAICDPAPDIDDISALTRVATPSSGKPPKPAEGTGSGAAGPGGGAAQPGGSGGHEGPRTGRDSPSSAPSTTRGCGSATRSAASWNSPRRAGTWRASGPAPTPCAGCTRPRPTNPCAAPSTWVTWSPDRNTTCSTPRAST